MAMLVSAGCGVFGSPFTRPGGWGTVPPMAKRSVSGTVRRWAAALAIAAVLIPASAWAAKIIGAVDGWEHLENPVWKEAKDPKNKGYSFREMVPTVPAKDRKLYPHIPKELCLAALATEDQKEQLPTLIRVGGGRTTPVTIVVPPGTKLVFENTDPFKHRLFIPNDKTFPPNDTEKGGKREWTVPKAGTFEIRDELAPSLRMWVVGEPKVAAITYPSMEGEYKLTVPVDGEYQVQAYFAGEKVGPAMPAVMAGRDIKVPKIVVAKPGAKEEK